MKRCLKATIKRSYVRAWHHSCVLLVDWPDLRTIPLPAASLTDTTARTHSREAYSYSFTDCRVYWAEQGETESSGVVESLRGYPCWHEVMCCKENWNFMMLVKAKWPVYFGFICCNAGGLKLHRSAPLHPELLNKATQPSALHVSDPFSHSMIKDHTSTH